MMQGETWESWGGGRVTTYRKLLLLPAKTSAAFRLTLEPSGKGNLQLDELRLHGG